MITNITWDYYIADCYKLADLIKEKQLNNLPIISISRGGVLPGLIVSHQNENPHIQVIGVHSYHDDKEIPERKQKFKFTQTPTSIFPSVLIVDDLVDSGRTLDNVKEYFENLKTYVYTAVLYSKFKDYKVDVKVQELDPKKWVIFPYEKG